MNEYKLEDLQVGHEESFHIDLTDEMMEKFLIITNDINPLHNDSNYAKKLGFDDKVVYGMLTASFLSTLAGCYLPGKKSLIQAVDVKFTAPVYVKDSLVVYGKIVSISQALKVIELQVNITNQKGKKVLRGTMQIGVQDEQA
ncbi:MAG: MaoC family dehydratase N-terminal domain-containing protein [Ruminococcus flavefaciens]|nr:MaoC family dehydratase N-terminal domain-containing protein [Ruminococcus flavefaciens]